MSPHLHPFHLIWVSKHENTRKSDYLVDTGSFLIMNFIIRLLCRLFSLLSAFYDVVFYFRWNDKLKLQVVSTGEFTLPWQPASLGLFLPCACVCVYFCIMTCWTFWGKWPFCVDVPLKHQSTNQSILRQINLSICSVLYIVWSAILANVYSCDLPYYDNLTLLTVKQFTVLFSMFIYL